MPTINWLKKEFYYGYESGNVLSFLPDKTRRNEEIAAGGSYRTLFKKAACPFLKQNHKVLELGCGKGSWTRSLLSKLPKGELTAIDFQDATPWLKPQLDNNRLKFIQVSDNNFNEFQDDYFDFFWSFGVLCHNNTDNIFTILKNVLPKMKKGSYASHQYGAWDKLEKFGWEKGRIPVSFKDKPDNEIWWPRNTISEMNSLATKAGWKVVCPDLNLLKRDGIIVLQKE